MDADQWHDGVELHPPPAVGAHIAALAGRQAQVVARRQLVALGLDSKAIARLIALGWLRPVHRGVYAVGTDRLTPLGRRWAAVLRVGGPAWIGHRTLAAALGLDVHAPADVDVTTTRRGRRPVPGITVRTARFVHPDDTGTLDGLPVLSPSRLVVDLAAQLARDPLAALVGDVQRKGVLDLDALAASVARARGRPNLSALTTVIREAEDTPPTRSELERRFAALAERAGVAGAQHNVNVVANGRPYEVDVLLADLGLAIELDGRRYHEVLGDFERDRTKDADLVVAGLRPIRLTWRRVVHRPVEVVALLRTLVVTPVRHRDVAAVRWHGGVQLHPPARPGARRRAVGDSGR